MTEPARKRRWWPIVAGVVVALCVVVAGLGVASVLWFRDKVDMRPGTSRTDAEAAFAAERALFPDQRPMLVVDDHRRPHYAEGGEGRRNPGEIESLRVLVWNPDKGEMATITLPFWLLRMKAGTFRFGQYLPDMDEGEGDAVRIEAKDLERYGRGIVLETETPKGDRVLITTR